MDQLLNVLLAIDKGHTVTERALDFSISLLPKLAVTLHLYIMFHET